MFDSNKCNTNYDNANLIASVFARKTNSISSSSTKGKITDYFQNKGGCKWRLANKKGKKKKHTVTKRSSTDEINLKIIIMKTMRSLLI